MDQLTQRDQLLNKVEAIQLEIEEIRFSIKGFRDKPEFDQSQVETADNFRWQIDAMLQDLHFHVRNIENK